MRKIKQNVFDGWESTDYQRVNPNIGLYLMSNRITIDFTSEPHVFAAIKRKAKKERRSLGRQLLFMCLPALTKATKEKEEAVANG